MEALHIDTELERVSRWWEPSYPGQLSFGQRLSLWLQRRLPRVILTPRLPLGHHSVESQLRARERFPDQEWMHTGLDVSQVENVLRVVHECTFHRNYFYLPEDSLFLVLQSSPNDFVLQETIFDLSRAWKRDLDAEIRGLLERHGTIGELVALVLGRTEWGSGVVD